MESINWLLSLILLVLAAILITLLDGWNFLRDIIFYIFSFVLSAIGFLLQLLFGLIGLLFKIIGAIWPWILGLVLFSVFIRLLDFFLKKRNKGADKE